MMKKLLLLLCVFSFSAGAFAQLEATWWYFGRAAGMKFTNNQNPVGVTDANPALNQDEGTATISSSNGDLLFYTDGRTVWNANHQNMQNGTGLLGNLSAAQSGVIVPFPGNTFPNRYAIFTVGVPNDGLRYNVVDMNLDNGLGGILPGLKNVPLILGTPEMVNAVERQGGGGTGPETWVVTKTRAGATTTNAGTGPFVAFHSFRLTQFGILFTPVTSNGVVTLANHTDQRGSLKISPDGRFLVTGNQATIGSGGGAHIYDYNNITGVVSNERSLNNTISGYGVGYDSCGNFLYVDDTTSFSGGIKNVYQYNLNAANIPATRTLVYTSPTDARGTLQIGPDGKLYVARINFPWVGIVDDPSLPMSSGNVIFTANGVDLLGRNSAQGLPTFLQSFFLAQTEITNELGILTTIFCEGADLNLQLDVTCFDINNVTADWDLGDGTTVLDDVGPFIHTYQSPGDFDITVLITFPDNSTRTLNVTVTVLPNGTIENEGDLFRFCEAPAGAGFLDIDLPTEFNDDVLGAQNPADFTVSYHATQTDADDNLNPITTLNVTTLNIPVDVWVRIENNELDLCTSVGLFQVIVDEAPVAGTVNDLPVCDIGNDGAEQIDLNQTFDAGVLNGQDPALFDITYHSSQADADTGANPLSSPFSVDASTPTFFARISNTNNADCNDTVSFNIQLFNQPEANAVPTIEICDINGDGVENIDLSTVIADALGTQNPADFNVSFHNSQADADNGSNALALSSDFPTGTNTVFVRVENGNFTECVATNSFVIIIQELPLANTAFIEQCDGPEADGIAEFDLTLLDADVLGGQNPADFTVTYHETQADADLGVNPIGPLYTNTTPGGDTIFARVVSNIDADCATTVAVDLIVTLPPVIGTVMDLEECDAAPIDGFTAFDLSVLNDQVLSGGSGAGFTITYHETQADAESGNNPLGNSFTNTQVDGQTIFARLTEDATGCFNITPINLIVDQCEIIIPQAFSPNGDAFNETFEIRGLREQFPNFRLQVFNRHGMEVYDGNISVPDWDGTSRFGSQSSSGRLPVGTYFYLLRFNDGVTEPRASFVYLNY